MNQFINNRSNPARQFALSTLLDQGAGFTDNATEGLLCPTCKSTYNDFNEPHTLSGEDDYKAQWGGRGDLLVIPMEGECGSRWEICLGFHKGETIAFVYVLESCRKG